MDLPPLALEYLPVLAQELRVNWPAAPVRSVFGAQVEQETCASLKSKKCWSPYAELKTSREYGFGLGQITVTERFNNFEAARALSPTLKHWTWENRYNATYQLRTLVLMNKMTYAKLPWAADPRERMSFTFAGYNGGLGGVLSDRAVCKVTPGCDPSRWFGHVEHTSKKSKVKVSGYGQSFFQINRGYVRNIMEERRWKYVPYLGL